MFIVKFIAEEAEHRNKFQNSIKDNTEVRLDTLKRLLEEELKIHREEMRVKLAWTNTNLA